MLPEKTMGDVATKLADELFAKKGAELDATIKLANVMYIQKCDNLDKRLEDSFIAAFEGEKISKERIIRIAGKFCDNILGKGESKDESVQV
jgi:hypothetical protein